MGSLAIIIVFIVISVISASARKTAAERAKRENAAPAARRTNMSDGEGKWFDEEYYGEGEPPAGKTAQSKPKPHTPKAHVSIPEPVLHTREAPQATVKTTLKTITASDEDDTPATIQIAGTDMSFSGDNALRAVIYSEVLSKPKSLR